ncbi:MAG: hypothetical protein KAY32_15375 [Candidatus Eisenbacteria sp.]|nr:hypothetical protein [Candidatus Eisenbacteria bacterium]
MIYLNGVEFLSSPTIQGTIGVGTGLTIPAITFSGDNTWSVAQTGVTLTSPAINGTVTTTGLTMPAFTSGDISLGANKLKTTNLLLKEGDASTLYIRDASDIGYRDLVMRNMLFKADSAWVAANPSTSDFLNFGAYDTGVGLVAVAQLVGHGDPYFSAGQNQEFKFRYGGVAYFAGHIVAHNYYEFNEMTAPGAGGAFTARVYAVQDGGSLTDLCAVFQDGTVDIFAQETTPLDSPIFTQPSGTIVSLVLKKEHPGSMKMVAVFSGGEEFVLREVQYHDADKIAASVGCEHPLPKDWEVTTLADRVAKNVAEIDDRISEIREIEAQEEIDEVSQKEIDELNVLKQVELARLD